MSLRNLWQSGVWQQWTSEAMKGVARLTARREFLSKGFAVLAAVAVGSKNAFADDCTAQSMPNSKSKAFCENTKSGARAWCVATCSGQNACTTIAYTKQGGFIGCSCSCGSSCKSCTFID